MGKVLSGKELARIYGERIINFVNEREEKKLKKPCLSAVLVGDDGGSVFYVNSQKKRCEKLGVEYRLQKFNNDITEEELLKVIHSLNYDREVDGIIVQLPLPEHIDEKKITSAIDPEKDVDGQTDINMGRFYKGEEAFIPCTPKAILELIKASGVEIKGKNAVVVGRSNIVGKPAAQLLIKEHATVTVCHSKTINLREVCRNADILVACVGRPQMITGEYIKEGAVVIDVGTSRVEGKMVGDVAYNEAIEIAEFVTPVPGGVGAVTTTMLIKNTCETLGMK